MILLKIFISILMTSTPLMIQAQNKLIYIVPRQVRRVHSHGSPMPWRQFLRQPFSKAINFLDNEFLPSQSHARPYISHHYRSKNRPPSYNKNAVPHGGDDFDQGHEEINHVMVPYGKGITHGISFGKGYVPQEALMHHAGFTSSNSNNHHATEDTSGYPSNGLIYSPSHLTQQADSYYQNDESDNQYHQHHHQDEGHERRADELSLKLMNIKSLGKSENNYDNGKSLITSRALPQITIGGSKTGIILQDTIGLEDYHKQILELTNTWPKPLQSPTAGVLSTTGIRSDGISQFNGGSQSLINQQLDQNYQGQTQFTSGFNLIDSYQRPGYSVKEDVQEMPHDFRTMPIQTAPPQTTTTNNQQQLPIVVQSSQNNNIFGNQGQTSSVQSQSQAIPGYYALTGFSGIAHN